LAVAVIALWVAYRQWHEAKRDAVEQAELTERLENNRHVAIQEQDRIIRAQSLDSYFEGISHLLFGEGEPNEAAGKFAKGRTDALLKVLKSDEKRSLTAFLYSSELITRDPRTNVPLIALSGSDLSGMDLGGATLASACLKMANLTGAKLVGSDLHETDFKGANLQDADLSDSDLGMAELHGANLSGATVVRAELSQANLSGADLRRADFSQAYMGEANLSGVNMREAILTGAYLAEADLSGTNMREAVLVGADLDGARLSNLISIAGADFTGVQNLGAEAREYLLSIASGVNPSTGRETHATLYLGADQDATDPAERRTPPDQTATAATPFVLRAREIGVVVAHAAFRIHLKRPASGSSDATVSHHESRKG